MVRAVVHEGEAGAMDSRETHPNAFFSSCLGGRHRLDLQRTTGAPPRHGRTPFALVHVHVGEPPLHLSIKDTQMSPIVSASEFCQVVFD